MRADPNSTVDYVISVVMVNAFFIGLDPIDCCNDKGLLKLPSSVLVKIINGTHSKLQYTINTR
ncbi:Hypothetical predicted protein [Prunus dulcis]|uniref:Uncharacterized protein n=1 Tax=Prunus dulcis TaxID=3755 RepID=A0A5E4GJ62_PRUDU|nr:Hypothetical predicted protein [Prunus dulcis]